MYEIVNNMENLHRYKNIFEGETIEITYEQHHHSHIVLKIHDSTAKHPMNVQNDLIFFSFLKSTNNSFRIRRQKKRAFIETQSSFRTQCVVV